MTHGTSVSSTVRWWKKLDLFDWATAPVTVLAGSVALWFSFLNKTSTGQIRWWFAGPQIALTVIAATVPVVNAIRAKLRESQAEEREIAARTQARLQVNRALDPIVRRLADGAGALRSVIRLLPGRQRRRGLREQVLSIVVNAAAGAIGPEGESRSCYLTLKAGRERELVPTVHFAGRMGATQTVFSDRSVNGKFVIDKMIANEYVFCEDIDREPPPGLDNATIQTLDYRTFISVPVIARDTIYGMLTVDAPTPKDLSQRDVNLMKVMAGLVAVAMALAH
jgi:hypothetical protein